ncbi:MAG TPA: glycine cleavage T C-terminal barrel domain-containing protein, partial [Actinomycetota bacterium]
EPVFVDDEPIGYVTSAAYGPSVERSIAYAWVPSAMTTGDQVTVGSFDERLNASVAGTTLFDPEGVRLRG